jgi:hypothetical protein
MRFWAFCKKKITISGREFEKNMRLERVELIEFDFKIDRSPMIKA